MKTPLHSLKLAALSRNTILAAVILNLALDSHAATISWGPAMQITGEADVLTNGILLEADAAGNNSSPLINKVTFGAWAGSSAHLLAGPGSSFENTGFNSAVRQLERRLPKSVVGGPQ